MEATTDTASPSDLRRELADGDSQYAELNSAAIYLDEQLKHIREALNTADASGTSIEIKSLLTQHQELESTRQKIQGELKVTEKRIQSLLDSADKLQETITRLRISSTTT